MSNTMEKFSELIGRITLGIGGLILGAVLGGWVLQHLWEWFILPTFTTHALGIGEAMGIKFVVGYFLPTPHSDKPKNFGTILAEGFVLNLLILGLGYILHFCIS